MKTDQSRLELIQETLREGYNVPRKAGKTIYLCHCIAGYLEVLNGECIIVILQNFQWLDHFTKTLIEVLKEYEIDILKIDYNSRRIFLKNNNNSIKFIILDYLNQIHPYDMGMSPDTNVIVDTDKISDTLSFEEFLKLNRLYEPNN